MNSNYYKAILNDDWDGLTEQAEWLNARCDSNLEVCFALSLFRTHSLLGENYNRDSRGWLNIWGDSVALMEPFAAAPSGNGWSIAHFTCQQLHEGRIWDFALHIGQDNGASFDQCKLGVLIDVDGFNVHRSRRGGDIQKLQSANVTAIRVPEELFRDLKEAASDVLFNTIYDVELSQKRLTKLIINNTQGGHDY
jgi:hypothetical protein